MSMVRGRRWRRRPLEARARALLEHATHLVVVCDAEGVVDYANPAAVHGLGLEPGPPPPVPELVDAEDRPALAAVLGGGPAPRSAQPETATVRLRGRGGRTFEARVRDLRADPAIRGFVITGHDTTARRSLERELERRALHDPLTGLPNRTLLADRLERTLAAMSRGGPPAALLLVDLDRFKEINDTLGHHVGDRVLTMVGPRWTGLLREADTVARLGGDEFAVLLPGVGEAREARLVARKLLESLAAPFRVDQLELHLDASVGVVVAGEHGTDQTTLLQRADVAMYVAKEQGLGVCVYDEAVDLNTPERLSLLGELRQAIDAGQMVLHFQPQVSLSTGEVCAAEALVRWDHPERGLLPPQRFVPAAERTGLIVPLTRCVLEQAVAQARRWRDAGRPLPVAVNISARNLVDNSLVDLVATLLRRHGLPADLLILELTESAIVTEPERSAAVLASLRRLGVGVAIDDFGAGYTSFAQLRSLHLSDIKIDRALVTGIDSDPRSALIVESLVELGHNLGLSITAEGVETHTVMEALRDVDCDVVQGFRLTRPLPIADFDAWRRSWDVRWRDRAGAVRGDDVAVVDG